MYAIAQDQTPAPALAAPTVVEIERVAARLDDMSPVMRDRTQAAYTNGMQGAFRDLCAGFSALASNLSTARKILGDDGNAVVLVASTAGRPVGIAVARGTPASDIFQLAAIGVARDIRGQGVGTQLFAGMVAELRDMGVSALQVNTPTALPFFKAQIGEGRMISSLQDRFEFGSNVHIAPRGSVAVTEFWHKIGNRIA